MMMGRPGGGLQLGEGPTITSRAEDAPLGGGDARGAEAARGSRTTCGWARGLVRCGGRAPRRWVGWGRTSVGGQDLDAGSGGGNPRPAGTTREQTLQLQQA
jgi:hypothetical protein